MASQSKTKTVKFEVGQLVLFSGHRVGRVSRIAKNGAIYVIPLGETTVADQTREELRVKKADLQLMASETPEALVDAAQEIAPQQASVVQESIAPMGEPIQSTLALESTEPAADFSLESAVALAEATYALRELTFSVTRHSILTAFIDVALNKNIPGYHYKVASNIKNLMEAAFDPVHDQMGYARINTWMRAALELLVKNKERVAKMLNQPIEAAPIKIDRVTKLGMWLDKNMSREGGAVNDLTAAYDSCYMYDALGKKLEACSFVVVEVIQSGDMGEVETIPFPMVGPNAPYQEYMTAQAAIARRKQGIDCYRPTEPDLHLYCGIVPVYKTGLSMQAAVEDTLASVISSLKGIK